MSDPASVMIAVAAFSAAAFSIRSIVTAVVRFQENKLKYSGSVNASAIEARMERMEQAVDAIAVEIERISEGQRFTTKLLSERT